MLPENQMNVAGLSPQSSANMLGTLGASVDAAMPPTEEAPSTENPMQKIALQFQTAWKALESLNGDYGGDADKFRLMQKALEDWFASLNFEDSASETNNY